MNRAQNRAVSGAGNLKTAHPRFKPGNRSNTTEATVMKLFDPTTAPAARALALARRPTTLAGLRLGLVDNTKFNSDTLLRKLAERLQQRHDTRVTVTRRKRSPSHEIDENDIKTLRSQADLVVSGIGD
jgi:hypothetical protein